MAPVTIRDVWNVSRAVSVLGTAALQDAALAAAPRLCDPGAPREELARVAAALIVYGVGEDPARYQLAPLTAAQRARAGEAFKRR